MHSTTPTLLALALLSLTAACADEFRPRYTGGISGGGGGGVVRAGGSAASSTDEIVEVANGALHLRGTIDEDLVDDVAGADHVFDGACTNVSGSVDGGAGVHLHLMPPLDQLPDEAAIDYVEADVSGTWVMVWAEDEMAAKMSTSGVIVVSRTDDGGRLVTFSAVGDSFDIVATARVGEDRPIVD